MILWYAPGNDSKTGGFKSRNVFLYAPSTHSPPFFFFSLSLVPCIQLNVSKLVWGVQKWFYGKLQILWGSSDRVTICMVDGVVGFLGEREWEISARQMKKSKRQGVCVCVCGVRLRAWWASHDDLTPPAPSPTSCAILGLHGIVPTWYISR